MICSIEMFFKAGLTVVNLYIEGTEGNFKIYYLRAMALYIHVEKFVICIVL